MSLIKQASEWKHLILSYPEFDIHEVQGDHVRNNINQEFVIGGHKGRFPEIPSREIWVEASGNEHDELSNILHEVYEARLMKEKQMPYVKAHRHAAAMEKAHRPESSEEIKDKVDSLALGESLKVKADSKEAYLKKAIKLPEIDKGDTILTGKYRNVPAEVKGIKKDENNQPVLETTKGDRNALSFRLEKLMPKKQASFKDTANAVWEQMPDAVHDMTTKDVNFKYMNRHYPEFLKAFMVTMMGGLGATIGPSVGTLLPPYLKRKAFLDAVKNSPAVDSKEFISKMSPDLKIFNKEEVQEYSAEQLPSFLPKVLRSALAKPYSSIRHDLATKDLYSWNIPQKGMVVADKLPASLLLHEIGVTKQDPSLRATINDNLLNPILGKTLRMEEDAWQQAEKMGPIDPKIKETALDMYRAAQTGSRVGTMAGPIIGGLSGLGLYHFLDKYVD